jgi:hypothetical protein
MAEQVAIITDEQYAQAVKEIKAAYAKVDLDHDKALEAFQEAVAESVIAVWYDTYKLPVDDAARRFGMEFLPSSIWAHLMKAIEGKDVVAERLSNLTRKLRFAHPEYDYKYAGRETDAMVAFVQGLLATHKEPGFFRISSGSRYDVRDLADAVLNNWDYKVEEYGDAYSIKEYKNGRIDVRFKDINKAEEFKSLLMKYMIAQYEKWMKA